MVVSEITMARLNHSNVLAHFSHAGCDDMADNTCHFGLNNMFAANGLPDEAHCPTRLYFPADQHQFAACVKKIFNDPGMRFLFSTRSTVPDILNDKGEPLHGPGYTFAPGKDELVREAASGGLCGELWGYAVSGAGCGDWVAGEWGEGWVDQQADPECR
jgi:transketolase C-terminal domain/subunit